METEGKEIVSISPESIAAFHGLLGINPAIIVSPKIAPSVFTLAEFWEKTVLSDTTFTQKYETFLGFDYDPATKSIVRTESTPGRKHESLPKTEHFIELHTEPMPEDLEYRLGPLTIKPTKVEIFAHDLPTSYLGDLDRFLSNSKVYSNITIRLGQKNTDLVAVLLLLKTQEFQNRRWDVFRNEIKNAITYDSKNPVSSQLRADKVVSEKCGIALYRGFVSIPPQQDEFLRLRRFS